MKEQKQKNDPNLGLAARISKGMASITPAQHAQAVKEQEAKELEQGKPNPALAAEVKALYHLED